MGSGQAGQAEDQAGQRRAGTGCSRVREGHVHVSVLSPTLLAAWPAFPLPALLLSSPSLSLSSSSPPPLLLPTDGQPVQPVSTAPPALASRALHPHAGLCSRRSPRHPLSPGQSVPSPLPPPFLSLHPNLPGLHLSALQTLRAGWLGARPKHLFGKWSYWLI